MNNLDKVNVFYHGRKVGTLARYKKYFINKSGIAYARLLLKYLTTKDKAILAKLKIRAREPKKCLK